MRIRFFSRCVICGLDSRHGFQVTKCRVTQLAKPKQQKLSPKSPGSTDCGDLLGVNKANSTVERANGRE